MNSSWRALYPPHPVAEVFPMMNDDELADLGADIKRHGLRIPVVVLERDGDRTLYLLDGRNRLEAMERAGLRLPDYPGTTLKLEHRDPVAMIVGLNIKRRHLTPGQRVKLAAAALEAAKKAPQSLPKPLGEGAATDGTPAETREPSPVSIGGRGRKSHTTRVAELAEVDKKTARKYLKIVNPGSETERVHVRVQPRIQQESPPVYDANTPAERERARKMLKKMQETPFQPWPDDEIAMAMAVADRRVDVVPHRNLNQHP